MQKCRVKYRTERAKEHHDTRIPGYRDARMWGKQQQKHIKPRKRLLLLLFEKKKELQMKQP